MNLTPCCNGRLDPSEINKFVLVPLLMKEILQAWSNNGWRTQEKKLVEFVVHYFSGTYFATPKSFQKEGNRQLYPEIEGIDIWDPKHYNVTASLFFMHVLDYAFGYNQLSLVIRALHTAEALSFSVDPKSVFHIYGKLVAHLRQNFCSHTANLN